MVYTDHASQWVKINSEALHLLKLDQAIQGTTVIALYNVQAIFK